VCPPDAVSGRETARQKRAATFKGGNGMNKQEMEGKWDKVKGSIKENVGDAIDNERLESEGRADRTKGEIKDTIGGARRNIGEAIEDVGEDIKR
jgi:uncharacterized protein YjbJ (UPF0337 family)